MPATDAIVREPLQRVLAVLFQAWLLALVLLRFLAVELGSLPRWGYGLLDVLGLLLLGLLAVQARALWARVPRSWLLLLGSGVLLAVVGVIANDTPPLAALAGLRRYCRFLPFAVLPWLWGTATLPWRRQGVLLLALLLLQLPLALHQRLAVPLTVAPGDHVTGTLGSPGFLTITLLCAVGVVAALWLHGRLRSVLALGLMTLLFVPCTLNESKSVLILLPVAVLVPLLLGIGRVAWSRLGGLLLWLLLAFALFFPVYDHFNYSRWGYTLWDFLFEHQRFASYLHHNAAGPRKTQPQLGDLNKQGQMVTPEDIERREKIRMARREQKAGASPPGKFDSIRLARRTASQAALGGWFGAGAGSLSASRMKAAEGTLARRHAHHRPDSTTVSIVLGELGWLGLLWLLAVMAWVLWQALRLAWCRRYGNGRHAVGAAACSVLVVLGASLLHKNLVDSPLLWGLFWYLAGVVVMLARYDGPLPRDAQGNAA